MSSSVSLLPFVTSSVFDRSNPLLWLPQMRFNVWCCNSRDETNVFCLETHSGNLPLFPSPLKPISGSAELGSFPSRTSPD